MSRPLLHKLLALTVSAGALAVFVFLGVSGFAPEAEAAELEVVEDELVFSTTPEFTIPIAGPAVSVKGLVLESPDPEPEPPRLKKKRSKKYAMGY